ncbi:cellulase family glycosylhydrolase [Natronosporangium hydrolyticum]|uniref:cellulase n=1 Tax=Natronosporangium hydrolyticum TaxID=2811111 RepID=A0A895YR43_9ACTN|nr:cellulase family glycosylhydrolase [Natronosporangium hydrolyticum]QSB16590.1 cellulase family glycosylhydrolase [Natronosporangium hydrolyticum]
MHGTLRAARWRLALSTVAITSLLTGLGVAAASTAHAATGCSVDYSAEHEWPGGFTGNVAITNLGDPVDGWDLEWTFPSGQQVTQAWGATVAQSGADVTASNVGYNGSIATNGTVSFGFNGSWSGSNQAPDQFVLNGTTCTGDVSEPPPTSPPPTTAPPTTPPTTPPPDGEDPMSVVAAMEPGWNLGNSLDAVGDDETAWGNPWITQELIQNIRAEGFNSIRIPVTWSAQQGPAPSYTIDQAYLDRVEEVVDWALDEDFYVMINIHHDSWQWIVDMPNDRTNVLDRYNAIWTQVADTFQDASPRLMFESVNEPLFTGSDDALHTELLHELNVSFHEIVRDSGGNNADRMLVLPTMHTGSEQPYLDALNHTIAELDDPNLIATVHFYGFWPFSVNVAGYTRFDDEVRQDIVDTFDRVHNAFVTRGIPVVIGEYGLLGFDQHVGTIQQGEKLKFFEFVNHYAQQTQLTTQIWDNGQHYNRNAMHWRDQEFYDMLSASWSGRSGTASADQVYVEVAGQITDQTLTLNRHGTTFEGLRHGSTLLTEGQHYTVAGDQLTITASTLTDLVGSQQYGVNADLHAEFSQGAPWRISVISYDTPILQDANGATNSFAVPTEFRGDQLATMEAVYADGSNAGPHDWTSFKEFSQAFEPDYDAGVIELTSTFFDSVNDGAPVTLTFHFWSGDTVSYEVVRSGSTVTGTAG